MADISYSAPRHGAFAAFFAGIGNFLTQLGENNHRVREVERLNAMSDEALAARGLRREDIVRHVFRDLLYV